MENPFFSYDLIVNNAILLTTGRKKQDVGSNIRTSFFTVDFGFVEKVTLTMTNTMSTILFCKAIKYVDWPSSQPLPKMPSKTFLNRSIIIMPGEACSLLCPKVSSDIFLRKIVIVFKALQPEDIDLYQSEEDATRADRSSQKIPVMFVSDRFQKGIPLVCVSHVALDDLFTETICIGNVDRHFSE